MYLVLRRHVGEKIICTLTDGQRIEVLVSRLAGDAVSLAVSAPKEVKVMRGELVETEPTA